LPVPTSSALPIGVRIEPCEDLGRRRDAQDVVGIRSLLSGGIAREQQIPGRCELERRAHAVAFATQDAQLDQTVELEPGERCLRLVRRHLDSEQEQLHLRPERPRAFEQPQVEREVEGIASARDVGGERAPDAGGGESGLREGIAEAGDALEVVGTRRVLLDLRHPGPS
jgi:hypothetical protein